MHLSVVAIAVSALVVSVQAGVPAGYRSQELSYSAGPSQPSESYPPEPSYPAETKYPEPTKSEYPTSSYPAETKHPEPTKSEYPTGSDVPTYPTGAPPSSALPTGTGGYPSVPSFPPVEGAGFSVSVPFGLGLAAALFAALL